MCCCIIWNVLKFINVASASYWPPWFPKLGWRVTLSGTALDAFGCKGSENLAKCKTNFKLSVVDSWNHISIFNLSTLELDNALQRLSFAGLWIVNSAKEWVQALYGTWKWVQNGCKFEMREKGKSRKLLTYRTHSLALQDGLEPTTPWLTVRCSNQLSYWSRLRVISDLRVQR